MVLFGADDLTRTGSKTDRRQVLRRFKLEETAALSESKK